MNIESQVLNVPIEDIIPNRFQPRLNFDESGLNELAASIKEHGIIQPLVLRRVNDKYEIIAGERRYKASKIAGLASVPAIISTMNDEKSAEVAIVENIQRRDLSAIEEAKSYKALLDKGYLTQEELAKKMGISQSAISNKLRLLSLDESVQQALMDGKISERHARTLLKLSNKEEQKIWVNKVINERMTVQSLEKNIKNIQKEEGEEPSMNTNNSEEKIEIVEPKKEIIPTKKDNVIPNKFFNFLEDEQANMSIEEPPVIPSFDDIELLEVDEPVIKVKDMGKANFLIDALVSDLKLNNYKVELVKDDNDKEIKYTIVVNKEDN